MAQKRHLTHAGSRLKAMLHRVFVDIGTDNVLIVHIDGRHNVAAIGDQIADKGQFQVFPCLEVLRGGNKDIFLFSEILGSAVGVDG